MSVELLVAVWNSTEKATIVTGWIVQIPSLGIICTPNVFSDAEVSTTPIEPGARAFCRLLCFLKRDTDPEDITKSLKDSTHELIISYKDIKQRTHQQAFVLSPLGQKLS